jgi:Skp family chaperone for outer membrane proteins
VRKSYLTALFAGIAVALGTYAASLTAQTASTAAPAAAPLPYLVAIVDMAQIIQNHPDYKTRNAALQEKIKAAEAAFTTRQQQILAEQKALEASPHKPGSVEHEQLLKALTSKAAMFDTDAKAQQRQFALERSKLMHEVYQDICRTISAYAAARSIAQVIDYREFEPDPAKPQTVADSMDRPLVWYSQRLNITQMVLNEIYRARNLSPVPNAVIGATPPSSAAPAVATPGTPAANPVR